MPALTLYFSSTAGTTGTKKLQTSAPASESSVATTGVTSTAGHYWELLSGGGAGFDLGTALPTWLFQDVPHWALDTSDLTLATGRLLSGTYTIKLKLSVSAGTAITVEPHVVFWRLTGRVSPANGGWCQLGEAVLPQTALTTTASVITGTFTLQESAFDTNAMMNAAVYTSKDDVLAVMTYVKIISSSGTQNINVFENGGANESIVTAGYELPSATRPSIVNRLGIAPASASTTFTGVFQNAITAGSTLVAFVSLHRALTTTDFSDSDNGAWTKIATYSGPSWGEITAWRIAGVLSGSPTITVTASGDLVSTNGITVAGVEITGASAPFDASNGAIGSTQVASDSLTPSVGNTLLLAVTDSDTSSTPGYGSKADWVPLVYVQGHFDGDIQLAARSWTGGALTYTDTATAGSGAISWGQLVVSLTLPTLFFSPGVFSFAGHGPRV